MKPPSSSAFYFFLMFFFLIFSFSDVFLFLMFFFFLLSIAPAGSRVQPSAWPSRPYGQKQSSTERNGSSVCDG